MKNKYIKNSHLSERKFRKIVKCYAADLTVSNISKLTGISRITLSILIQKIRRRIYELIKKENPFLCGEIEVDESYFGARKSKDNRGRGASRKKIVFGMLKRDGKVYTEVVKDCSKDTLLSIIGNKISKESIIHSDGWKGYDGLVDFGYKKHYRVKHGNNEFVNGDNHINGIESFWGYVKHRLSKFKGMNSLYFDLHLKESEFRFNSRKEDLYMILLKEFRNNPL